MQRTPKSSALKTALTRSWHTWPSGPTRPPAHLARALSWQPGSPGRTMAVAPDGLCRETTPPARPEDHGEKLSFSHWSFAASRLRVKSVPSNRQQDAWIEMLRYGRTSVSFQNSLGFMRVQNLGLELFWDAISP